MRGPGGVDHVDGQYPVAHRQRVPGQVHLKSILYTCIQNMVYLKLILYIYIIYRAGNGFGTPNIDIIMCRAGDGGTATTRAAAGVRVACFAPPLPPVSLSHTRGSASGQG